ncbi:outer membrane protein assembly factor BamB [Halohasta litchfieldiae]|uniref:Outer membrane protein assembly factor BamB, contains PQQ-like beta-propeller repeat n=1 Tax=Halohasta litchfieldiae TaxID=1073996 RepID=A0A1H6VFG1_9EURY|nr:PQQ-binding-like beta-propeller repeat protein [Halohasta litchfieldiae]ATW88061.1 outer membrane protein assembly factor BamB [Halohasta litchfieldiae]SEJ03293.1 Outer membrane protein assembly factor BamB, contains PQQ-like beta-propeller repeat [Halohasta litchfieldiae]
MNRRSVLGVLASTSLTGIAGCLGDSGNDGAKPATTPIMNREVPIGGDIGGVIPQFQGSPEHTGNLDATGPTDGVTTYWRRTPHRYDHSQPVVVDDRVYVSFGGKLVQLDRATGQRQWITDVGHDGSSTPAVYDGTVYVTVWNGGENEDRGLAAVDADSGDITWRALTDADINSSPAVTEDGVLVGGGLGTTSVAAFDHDGTERWRHTLGEYASTPAVTGETVVYGAGTPQVVSYDAVSGERLWQFDTDGETTAAPTIADNRVVVGTQAGTLYSLDLQDGSKEWSIDLPGSVRRSVAIAENRIIIPTVEGLIAVDTAGNRDWTVDTSTRATEPVIAGDGVYFGDRRILRALSLTDGTEWWSFETRNRSFSDFGLGGIQRAPAITNGIVIVATQAGDVYALGEK